MFWIFEVKQTYLAHVQWVRTSCTNAWESWTPMKYHPWNEDFALRTSENRQSQKEIHLPTIDFFWGYVSFREGIVYWKMGRCSQSNRLRLQDDLTPNKFLQSSPKMIQKFLLANSRALLLNIHTLVFSFWVGFKDWLKRLSRWCLFFCLNQPLVGRFFETQDSGAQKKKCSQTSKWTPPPIEALGTTKKTCFFSPGWGPSAVKKRIILLTFCIRKMYFMITRQQHPPSNFSLDDEYCV